MKFLALAALTFIPTTLAHFVLQYPNSLGFDDDTEGQSPCGGSPIVFASNDTSVTIGGFAVSMLSTHPQAQWLFRATTQTQAPFTWTNLLPVVSQQGLGQFCLPALTVPAAFEGKQGIVQVIQNAADGELYQCAAVNFVSGVNSTVGSACTNTTGLTASITSQDQFSNATTSGSASATHTTASATHSSGAKALSGQAMLGGLFAVGAALL